jgi:hypothetical protein
LAIPGAADLHQVRFRDGLLWLVNGRRPELLAVEPSGGRLAGCLALSDWVPAGMRHGAPPQHPGDAYHFNSLHFSEDRLYVLAHNWGFGSFVLELAYEGPGRLFRGPRRVAVHRGLGVQSHDVCRAGAGLWVLDSGNGRLLGTDGTRRPLVRDGGAHFLRGLAVGDRFLYAAHGGYNLGRPGRLHGPTGIIILDRRSWDEVAQVHLGPYGNTCGCLLLSETDWSDSSRRKGRLLADWVLPFPQRAGEFSWPTRPGEGLQCA